MSVIERILNQRRLILFAAVFLALAGIGSVLTMPREEDPRLKDYWGIVVTAFPGADAEKVERLVADPEEEHLAEVEEIKHVQSTIRSGVVVTNIELWNPQENIEEPWDEVRRALEKARREFPDAALEPVLDRDIPDTEAVVLAITGSTDPLVLGDAADQLKKDFLALRDVARVLLIADPEEQITIEFDDSPAKRLNIDPRLLVQQLSARNLTIPGGSIRLGGKKVILRLNDEFESVEEIASSAITLPSGAALPLSEVAKVRRGPQEPASSKMRFNGKPAVGLGIIPRKGISVVRFGESVRQKLAQVRPRYSHVQIHEVTFQPERVSARLLELGKSLLMSIVIVAGVLILFMGIRLGLTVAILVPFIGLSSLALFHWGGGTLHQVSIAAFVISLGMLVDNAIVISESVQRGIDSGVSANTAAIEAVKELALPLATATATTLAAFIPMLIAHGPTAEFTHSLPVVIMITLTVSYFFAVSVTPILSAVLLKEGQKGQGAFSGSFVDGLSTLALRKYGWILFLGALLVVGSGVAFQWVDHQFFPLTDRNQLVVDLKLPEGAHLDEIDAASNRLEHTVLSRPEVISVASFMGRGAPHFYYNIPRRPNSPHLAQLIITAACVDDLEDLLPWIRDFMAKELPEVEPVVRRLQQGPPVETPIELRIIGKDMEDLRKSAELVLAKVRSDPDTVETRHDLGVGVPTIRLRIDDAVAARQGLSRSDVALAVRGRTRGLQVGKYQGGDDPVPILVRSAAGEEYPVRNLSSIDVAPLGGKPVPLAQLAHSSVEWMPAVIRHRNRERLVTVFSQVADGSTYSRILNRLGPELSELDLPPGVRIEYGGDAEASDDANRAMFQTLPVGILILIAVLLAQFNSFRRLAIILVTVPLAATGVVPGLLLSGQAFSFMSLLGVIALVGVVVNNAIVLIDRIELRRARGEAISDAIAEAVSLRTRPILLTTATTVCGLLPLAFSSSTLWPPMAWAMISGLIASTGLTLLVVPSLYKVLFFREALRETEVSAAP